VLYIAPLAVVKHLPTFSGKPTLLLEINTKETSFFSTSSILHFEVFDDATSHAAAGNTFSRHQTHES
jgi:hypothetical protein